MATDPATGAPLPSDAIQRILFLAPKAHVYAVPPLTSTKGYSASAWTAAPQNPIFTARCRIVETAHADVIKADIVLEDQNTGELFAAAPYADRSAVEPVLDSSRFFALQVRDPQGRKAVLGLGFEERSEAFDFGVALQEAGKAVFGVAQGDKKGGAAGGKPAAEETRDLSLKEGETITINLGGSKGRRLPRSRAQEPSAGTADLSAFSIPPPPSSNSASGGGTSFLIPPPPPAGSRGGQSQQKSAEELGFNDGEFGEFK
ncbi:related to adaptin ear-binding coat-associated protein 1 [Cephalotrichum gorgonifer]|uniref:Related to adaptin ear-binding coat-associated protein 1 n=1 Tax=Cephalotrichum gorgonifer TaxID=2041049 RepID=A0AAE8N6N4_9PEZI|nr:related to adaptin ear-binding coat-associated protein 1 [Cephalotrichum gorgonifer]